MKKTIALLLSMALLASFAGCSKKADDKETEDPTESLVSQIVGNWETVTIDEYEGYHYHHEHIFVCELNEDGTGRRNIFCTEDNADCYADALTWSINDEGEISITINGDRRGSGKFEYENDQLVDVKGKITYTRVD